MTKQLIIKYHHHLFGSGKPKTNHMPKYTFFLYHEYYLEPLYFILSL